mmetsp:Transcript_59907/g.173478  ORF Transcript_59907/g.173478 Transcript_59907/m.173478 type:complete len:266 (+) Transcript_59907:1-798(+)
MVKCAMLDEQSAADVVLSNCEEISEQIEQGVERLRAAAKEDSENPNRKKHSGYDLNFDINGGGQGESSGFGRQSSISKALATLFKSRDALPKLPQVLHEFSAELSKKQFSAASTDKLVIDKRLQSWRRMTNSPTQPSFESEGGSVAAQLSEHDDHPDRRFVKRIMADFVEHLAKHWTHEKARQASRQEALKSTRGSFAFSTERARVKCQRCCSTLPGVRRRHDDRRFGRSTSPFVRGTSPMDRKFSPSLDGIRFLAPLRETSVDY